MYVPNTQVKVRAEAVAPEGPFEGWTGLQSHTYFQTTKMSPNQSPTMAPNAPCVGSLIKPRCISIYARLRTGTVQKERTIATTHTWLLLLPAPRWQPL